MKRQWKVAVGFAVLAVLVGLGVVPARRAMTVRVAAPPKERPAPRKVQARRSLRIPFLGGLAPRKVQARRSLRIPLLSGLARRVRRWRR